MPIEETEYGGWQRNLRVANDSVELIITLEVGPRIISYRSLDASNVFKNYPAQLGKSGEPDWMIRGGHRHWIAPEDTSLTYLPDNEPFAVEKQGDLAVKMSNPGLAPWFLKKETLVEMAPSGSQVRVTHTVVNESAQSWPVAPWALTVMSPGGTAILPQPPLGSHPRDLLPNRKLILWPYADLTDYRLHLGRWFTFLSQKTTGQPIKFGLAHQGGWAAYLLGDQLFIKTVPFDAGVEYPDFGCNFESFTNHEMLEVETLGELKNLAPGESLTLAEDWHLFSRLTPPPLEDSPDFAAWLQPLLEKAGLA